MNSIRKYSLLLSLYLAQSIPMSFFSTVLPVIMRMEKYSLESIGYIQLIKLPWILKFLWAPMVDRNGTTNQHFKKWIIASELFYAVVIISIGFFNLSTEFSTIVVLMIIAFVASATQDIASDALAIRLLKKEERSLGNSMQSAGSFLGTLCGSGVLLVLYSLVGWTNIMFLLAGFVLLAIMPLLWVKKQQKPAPSEKVKPITFLDIFRFFSQKGMGRRIILLVLFYSGLIGALTMLKPYMVDLGYSIKEIGFMSGIFGTACGALSALGAGFILKKTGNKKGGRYFATFNLVPMLFFLWYSTTAAAGWMIYVGIALLWSAYAMSSVFIYTISMNAVRQGREGTDFTIQIVLTHLSSLIIAVMSGKITDIIGYTGLFAGELMLGILVLVLFGFLFHEITGRQEHETEQEN
ncbi:MFS transporter [Puteibacter caeruleilacunae]|nr:MFS transporter [Puteibacter caeruleilacunae]